MICELSLVYGIPTLDSESLKIPKCSADDMKKLPDKNALSEGTFKWTHYR